ncbi:MAG: hypothetical protein K2O01_05670 [Bacteroidales bacterium]|nr:hypothetical protein [Bacteroidales bacterium]
MKKTIVCGMLLSLFAGFSHLDAQEVSVSKTPMPSEAVMQNFEQNYGDAENPVWYTYHDINGNEFYFVAFTRDGDQKRIYYKNNRQVNLQTVIPVEYCPRKIKNVTASLHPDFQIADMVYMQSIYGSFYRVTLTKGKKKKMERMTMVFSPSGELQSGNNDAVLDMIKEFDVTPPAK